MSLGKDTHRPLCELSTLLDCLELLRGGRGRGGKSLFDRVHDPQNRGQRGGRGNHHGQNRRDDQKKSENGATEGDDVEMGGT